MAGRLLPEHQRVHGGGTFQCADGLEVAEVADDVMVRQNARAPKMSRAMRAMVMASRTLFSLARDS